MEIKNLIIKNSFDESLSCVFRDCDSSKPVVITLHALSGKKENRSIHSLAENLPDEDFNTLEFDFSGHGESEGNIVESTITKQLSDLKSVIDYFKFEKVILVGNSFSVIAALAFAELHSDLVSGLVLISGRADYLKFCDNTRKDNYKLFGDDFLDEDYLADYMKYNPLEAINKLNIPVAIVHGTCDDVIPFSDAKNFFDVCPSLSKELISIKDGAHRFDDKSRLEMFDKVSAFLKKTF
jgi:pimeloyl-ACP methyl ester carboxylesterase